MTACKSCNQRKDDRTPEEAGMRLLAVPYIPNHAEYLILSNRRILADQMEFLQAHAPTVGAAPIDRWPAFDRKIDCPGV